MSKIKERCADQVCECSFVEFNHPLSLLQENLGQTARYNVAKKKKIIIIIIVFEHSR